MRPFAFDQHHEDRRAHSIHAGSCLLPRPVLRSRSRLTLVAPRESPTEVLVVTGEPVWPPHHGGRIRVHRMVEELQRHLAVSVAAPIEGPPPNGLPVDGLPPARPVTRLQSMATLRPRLGRTLLGPERAVVLGQVLARRRPRTVLFINSYVAATAPRLDIPTAVDFHDVEVRRMASLSRLGHPRSRAAYGLEAAKALLWEASTARRATVVSAVNGEDVRILSSWGANAIHVPSGADRFEVSPSPARGPVTFVASFSYAPNRLALTWLLKKVWPRLRGADPELRLRLVGRRANEAVATEELDHAIEVVSDPGCVDAFYQDASVILAPVRAGGGCQLKVTEALARGRAVVATTFSSRSVPPGMIGGVVVADDPVRFAAAVLRLWRDLSARRQHEKAIATAPPPPTWQQACAPLVQYIERLVRTG